MENKLNLSYESQCNHINQLNFNNKYILFQTYFIIICKYSKYNINNNNGNIYYFILYPIYYYYHYY